MGPGMDLSRGLALPKTRIYGLLWGPRKPTRNGPRLVGFYMTAPTAGAFMLKHNLSIADLITAQGEVLAPGPSYGA